MTVILLVTALAAVALSLQGRRVARRRQLGAGSLEQLATVMRWDLSAVAVLVIAGGTATALAGSIS